jgi:adenine-specific DNA-methyltransferase
MARARKAGDKPAARKRRIEQYDHKGRTRKNNPPVGLVTEATDRDASKKRYAYDPHLDPALSWAGKAEHTSFEVPTISLHVHERIDPKTIMEAVRRQNGTATAPVQGSLFESPEENPPLREAIDFYQHAHAWSNRLIAGDSLLVMNSLLEKEGMAGKVQMVYIDPPYGIRYGSNFQPFVNKRDVKDGSDEDLTQEPEMIRAFRDTWELGIHSYLTYLRDRLLLARELLHESGSCFVQISDENVHRVRNLLDEVFGAQCFAALIAFKTTGGQTDALLPSVADYLVWYVRDPNRTKYRQLYVERGPGDEGGERYNRIELSGGRRRPITREERDNPKMLPPQSRLYRLTSLVSQGYRQNTSVPWDFGGLTYDPGTHQNWKTTLLGLDRLVTAQRVDIEGNRPAFVRYLDDFPVRGINSIWSDTQTNFGGDKRYVVQTADRVIQRCVLMSTDPGDLVFDPTCGSGTTVHAAEQWGRRWITCDTSRVAVTLTKQRLMTAAFDYYELAHPAEGVGSGFVYKTVPHVTLKSVANNEPPGQETLYDQPRVDGTRVRVTGPFTVEAVPAPTVRPLADAGDAPPADASVARSGETLRQAEWRAELLKTGIRGKNNQMILFSRVEALAGTRWLHADAESLPNERGSDRVSEPRPGPARSAERVVVSFGPEHAPLEQRQVELAWEEARTLSPRPGILAFAAFQFDPEAAKDIDELTREKTGMTFLKVQMNPDLLTADLKKKRASNESFWLMGQPDVEVRTVATGEHKGKLEVEVHGFDYYNTKTGQIESGDTRRIALWMLDPDYDGRSLFPRQVFFPMADEAGGWARLTRNLKAEIDEERIEAYRGTVSLPFEAGPHKRVAVKIVDDRGIESLKIIPVP